MDSLKNPPRSAETQFDLVQENPLENAGLYAWRTPSAEESVSYGQWGGKWDDQW